MHPKQRHLVITTNARYNDYMLRWRWHYAIPGIVLFLIIAGSFFSLWAVRSYLTQQIIPDLENKFQLQIQTSSIELNPFRGILIHQLKIRSPQPEFASNEFSASQILLWSYPWKWWRQKAIEFNYQVEGVQQSNLKILGKGTWDRDQKILTIEPVFEGSLLTSFLSPLKTSLSYGFQSQEWTVAAQTPSGITAHLQGTKSPEKLFIQPSWIRFQDSFLEYHGDFTKANNGAQLYLDTTGDLKLDQIEKLLTGKTELFDRINPELSHIEFGTAVENNQIILEDLVANYALGYLSIRGVYDLAVPHRFRISLRGDQMELSDLMEEPLKKGKPIEGLITWSITFHGNTKNLNTLEGQGLFEISDGRLWDLTVFQGLAKALQIPQLRRVTFNGASGRFLLKQKQWSFPQVQLRSQQLILDGRGTIEWNGELNFTVGITFSQEFLKQIGGTPSGLIASLLTNPSGETFTQIRITGTLQDPKYKIDPIPPKKIFQGIFQRILK